MKTDQLFLVDENNKGEFQQGTLRLNIRQNFTSGRIASRVERLPGGKEMTACRGIQG